MGSQVDRWIDKRQAVSEWAREKIKQIDKNQKDSPWLKVRNRKSVKYRNFSSSGQEWMGAPAEQAVPLNCPPGLEYLTLIGLCSRLFKNHCTQNHKRQSKQSIINNRQISVFGAPFFFICLDRVLNKRSLILFIYIDQRFKKAGSGSTECFDKLQLLKNIVSLN